MTRRDRLLRDLRERRDQLVKAIQDYHRHLPAEVREDMARRWDHVWVDREDRDLEQVADLMLLGGDEPEPDPELRVVDVDLLQVSLIAAPKAWKTATVIRASCFRDGVPEVESFQLRGGELRALARMVVRKEPCQ